MERAVKMFCPECGSNKLKTDDNDNVTCRTCGGRFADDDVAEWLPENAEEN